MSSKKIHEIYYNSRTSYIIGTFRRKLCSICSKLRSLIWRRPRTKVIIRRFGKTNFKGQTKRDASGKKSSARLNGHLGYSNSKIPIRLATFNVAMFSLAPAISKAEELAMAGNEEENYVELKSDQVETIKNFNKSTNYHPKSILKQSPLHTSVTSPDNLSKQKKHSRSKLKVSINLPDNEISLANSNALMRSPVCLPSSMITWSDDCSKSGRSIAEVLREVDADILALQDVKAEEGNAMKPLSDLAAALGMKYVFAESWAPEYGNAILSKWPIKTWKVQKIADDKDFRYLILHRIFF